MHSLNYAVGQMKKLHAIPIQADSSPQSSASLANDKFQMQIFAWTMFSVIAGPVGFWLLDVALK